MNLTLSLLAGLLLLLPGIAAVAAWNHGGQAAARRPELSLTSITAIFALLIASIVAHVAGYLLIATLRSALVEAGDLFGWSLGPIFRDPYATALQFTLGSAANVLSPDQTLASLATFITAIAAETALAFFLVVNPGLDIAIEHLDLRGQGWVHQNIVRPMRHGYRPIAYVLTSITSGDRGVGYEGVVADIRQGADGEIKALCLGEPSRFVYELREAKARKIFAAGAKGREQPDVEIYESEWVGGVIALESTCIRNIVIHIIKEDAIDDVVEDPVSAEAAIDAV